MRAFLLGLLALSCLGCFEQPRPAPLPPAAMERIFEDVAPAPPAVEPVVEPQAPPPAAPLPMALQLDEELLAAHQEPQQPALRLLVFGAEYCGPCVVQKPLIEAAARSAGLTVGPTTSAVVQMIEVDNRAASQWVNYYRPQGLPTYVLVDTAGKEIDRRTGASKWPELLSRLAPASSGSPTGLQVGTLDGGRTSIEKLIEVMRPLLLDGGRLSVTYQVPGEAEPAIPIAGKLVRLGNPTQLAWSLEGDVLRCQLTPPATVVVKSFPIRLRGFRITPERIVLDLPWLPDAEIDVR